MNIFNLITYQSIGGMNEGLSDSMDGFMSFIHGFNDVANWFYEGYIEFTNGVSSLGSLFGG